MPAPVAENMEAQNAEKEAEGENIHLYREAYQLYNLFRRLYYGLRGHMQLWLRLEK